MNIKLRNLVAATLAGTALLGFAGTTFADTTDDIVNALMAKGILTEEEGALLMRGRTGEKEAADKKKKEGVSAKIKDGSISWESGDGNTSVALTGRMHFDARNSDIDFADGYANKHDKDTGTGADQFELRRARMGVKGKLLKNFKYEAVTNLVGSAPTVDVAYLDFAKYDKANIRFGKFKQPFNLEELTSSNNIDFMERSYVNQIAPAKKLGMMVMGELTPGFNYAGSVFQMNDTELDYDSEGASFAGRLGFDMAPLMGHSDAIYHVGLSGFDSEYSVRSTSSSSSTGGTGTSGTFLAFRSGGRGLSNIFRAQIQGENTGAFQSALSDKTSEVEAKAVGLEGVFAKGPFKIQAEYANADHEAKFSTTKMELDSNVWYAEAMWLITGEHYADFFKKGVFGGIKPKNELNFDEGGSGWGAVELGLRMEGYDVDDGSITGGNGSSRFQGGVKCDGANGSSETATGNSTQNGATETGCKSGAKAYTAGIKWILNPNLMFKANYTHTKFDYDFDHFDVGGTKFIDSEDLFMMRGQWTF